MENEPNPKFETVEVELIGKLKLLINELVKKKQIRQDLAQEILNRLEKSTWIQKSLKRIMETENHSLRIALLSSFKKDWLTYLENSIEWDHKIP